jgi:CelD/BcsL family acetyltransferase involved in cellulose biosynthesis
MGPAVSDVRLRMSPLEDASDEWDRLADRLGASPFNRPGWSRIWREAFGGPDLSVLLALRQDRVVGALPLQLRLGRVHSPTNWHTPGLVLLAEDPEVARHLVTGAVDQARWQVQVEFLGDEDASLFRSAARGAGWSLADHVMQTSPYIELTGTFEDYRASLSRNTRKQLNRKRRDADARGCLRLEVRSDFDPEAFAAFVRLEGSGWKEAQGSAMADNPREVGFYREAARWAAGRGWLRLAFLRLDDELVAGDLALECEGAHLVLKTGYAPEWEELSPGRLLREDSIRRAFAEGLITYEFLGNAARWKWSWTSQARRLHRITAFAPNAIGRALRSVEVRGRPVAGHVRLRWREWRRRG